MKRSAFACSAALWALALSGCGKSPPGPAEGVTVAEGLELTLWAAEPLVVNPTNMAIDERGRVWITEAVNYRRKLKDQPDLVAEGDRVVILEDSNGDGRADRRKVFDQNPELRAPLGIAVLGDKVYVSQSPNLIVYTKDEDDRVVSKKTLLTGFGGFDHDHGLHAIVFGFDGRLYFNHGDRGFDVEGPDGRRVKSSPAGPFYAGCVLRMNEDGTDLTVLAHNFRNPYEAALDSFGTIWQTDNDDDGNEWTRLNYVMEGGDFGYWGPGGKRWREDRGTHFHHELPGVVPDIARTGPGSPTGLIVYEGDLLPERYRGALMHSEPGKRRLFTFLTEPAGAGYRMTAEETVVSADPDWRPSDLAVAPDGAVLIADWHDPVVGGHNMLDAEQGRVHRLAPAGHRPAAGERLDLESPDGLRAALASPNQAIRYRADREIMLRGAEALPLLEALWRSGDRASRARALWLLARVGGPERSEIDAALASPDPDFRVLGLRVARLAGRDVTTAAAPLLEDPDPRVRRECALALRELDGAAAVEALTVLAKGYDGEDRWYLEAWAIGARGKEPALAEKLKSAFPGPFDPRLADFYWQIRPDGALPYLTRAVRDARLDVADRLRALRAIGDREERAAARTTADVVGLDRSEIATAAFDKLSRQLFSRWIDYRDDPAIRRAVRRGLATPGLRAAALETVDALGDPAYGPDLLALVKSDSSPAEQRAAALRALGRTGRMEYLETLESRAATGAAPERVAAIQGLAALAPPDLAVRLEELVQAEGPNEARAEALRALGREPDGIRRILDLEEAGKLPPDVKTIAVAVVRRTRDPELLGRADRLLPRPKTAAAEAVPVDEPWRILSRDGDPARGRAVFERKDGPKCATCHSLEPGEERAGPNLSAIGAKYDKRGLLDSILNPSAGIAPEYYVWILDTAGQGLVIGVLAEDTPERVLVRNEFGDEIRLKPDEIVSRRKSDLSMMPDDIVNTMSERELIDLLEFLARLRAPGEVAAGG